MEDGDGDDDDDDGKSCLGADKLHVIFGGASPNLSNANASHRKKKREREKATVIIAAEIKLNSRISPLGFFFRSFLVLLGFEIRSFDSVAVLYCSC